MIDGFTVLAFGFCAMVALLDNTPVALVGIIEAHTCAVRIAEKYHGSGRIDGHAVAVMVGARGAVVWIDRAAFAVPATRRC